MTNVIDISQHRTTEPPEGQLTEGGRLYALPQPADSEIFDIEALESLDALCKGIENLRQISRIVSSTQTAAPTTTNEGTITRFGYELASGYRYAAMLCQPHNPASDKAIIGTTAWWVGLRGHAERVARNFMKAGFAYAVVGAEGSYHPSVLPKVPYQIISLAGSAAATLTISEDMLGYSTHDLRTDEATVVGESRSSMAGMGIMALSGYFGPRTQLHDFAAACYPRCIDINNALGILLGLPRVPAHLGKLALHLGFGRLRHYPPTVDAHPESVLHQLAIFLPLINGEAGDLARLKPPGSIAHLTTFSGDSMTMHDTWNDDIFVGDANVRITRLPGIHTSLADPETVSYVIGRRRAYDRLVSSGVLVPSGDEVFNLAHDLAEPQSID